MGTERSKKEIRVEMIGKNGMNEKQGVKEREMAKDKKEQSRTKQRGKYVKAY